MFIVIDVRNNDIKWNGTKSDCKWWISMTDPLNRKYYKLAKLNDKGELELL